MKEQITYDIFDKVDIRVGTVISVSYTHLRAHETRGLGDVYKRQE